MKINYCRKSDISEKSLLNYSPVTKKELKDVGCMIADYEDNTLYLDHESYRNFEFLKYSKQQQILKNQTDPRTGFVIGSDEYNNYYFPKIDKAGRSR